MDVSTFAEAHGGDKHMNLERVTLSFLPVSYRGLQFATLKLDFDKCDLGRTPFTLYS